MLGLWRSPVLFSADHSAGTAFRKGYPCEHSRWRQVHTAPPSSLQWALRCGPGADCTRGGCPACSDSGWLDTPAVPVNWNNAKSGFFLTAWCRCPPKRRPPWPPYTLPLGTETAKTPWSSSDEPLHQARSEEQPGGNSIWHRQEDWYLSLPLWNCGRLHKLFTSVLITVLIIFLSF